MLVQGMRETSKLTDQIAGRAVWKHVDPVFFASDPHAIEALSHIWHRPSASQRSKQRHHFEGRFGTTAKLVRIIFDEPRQISSGTLLHAGPDAVGPFSAIGVVLRDSAEGAIALVDDGMATDGLAVSLSDQGQPISALIRLLDHD